MTHPHRGPQGYGPQGPQGFGPQGYGSHGHYPPPAPPTPPPAPRPWYRRKRFLIPGGLILLVIISASLNGGNSTNAASTPGAAVATPAPTPQIQAPAAQPAPPPPPAPSGPLTSFGNGTYEVGSDVAPGRYRSPGVQSSFAPLCYWDLTDTSGKIVDQGVANEGPSRATLREGLTFKSQGCEDWQKAG